MFELQVLLLANGVCPMGHEWCERDAHGRDPPTRWVWGSAGALLAAPALTPNLASVLQCGPCGSSVPVLRATTGPRSLHPRRDHSLAWPPCESGVGGWGHGLGCMMARDPLANLMIFRVAHPRCMCFVPSCTPGGSCLSLVKSLLPALGFLHRPCPSAPGAGGAHARSCLWPAASCSAAHLGLAFP